MKSKIAAALSLVALVAAGAGTHAVANVRSDADFQAPVAPEAASCDGYYNEVVGICEIMGD
ncbi:MAG: hypothetical protein FJZ38_07760 [Candidatus Rokubacteria bacterium]|nr:hypothetical protein [Candidatus Rokubacteria bacterium]